MALTISATNTELQKPVNVIFQQTLLRNAKARCPYFMGTQPGSIARNGGTSTIKWRRIENLTPTTTALAELVGAASYMQGRDSSAAQFTDVTATLAKYGQFYILNEEVDIFNFNGQSDKLFETLGISSGRSLNQLQRNVIEDNATVVRVGSVASDGAIVSAVTANALKEVILTLNTNSALTFTPMTTGSQNIGTSPILPAYWAICHPHVAADVAGLTGFTSVEKYAGQVETGLGEFGTYSLAGQALRFLQTEDASTDAGAGGTTGSTGLRGSTNIDLYTISIYGMDAVGSVGLGQQHTVGAYMAGDPLPVVDIIHHMRGSGGTSDPYDEIETMAWKAWHAGAILNANWARALKVGATDITA